MPFSDTLLTTYPRSTITQSGALDRIRGDVGLRGTNLLTDADLIAWMNEGSDYLAEALRWYRTSTQIDATAGQKEYPFPAGLIALQEVHHNELPMALIQLGDFQRNYAYWRRQGDGTPLWYYVRGNSGFGLHPTPGTTIVNGLLLIYTGTPPHPVNGSDTYTIPASGERALLSYAKLLAAEKDSSGEGRARLEVYTRRWERDFMALQRAVESASEGEVTVLGSDDTPEGGAFSRWWGFDPNRTAAGPPG